MQGTGKASKLQTAVHHSLRGALQAEPHLAGLHVAANVAAHRQLFEIDLLLTPAETHAEETACHITTAGSSGVAGRAVGFEFRGKLPGSGQSWVSEAAPYFESDSNE